MSSPFLAAALLFILSQGSPGAEFPGKAGDFHGYARHDFERRIGDAKPHKCIVVEPKEAAEGRPWIWRARFFGHQPQADLVLLEKGFHLVYCDISGLFGDAVALARWDEFYQYLTTEHQLAEKVALEGFSRGGLIIFNWAAKNPGKVACIYGDAPVCDIRSWPGGFGKGKASPKDWRIAIQKYGLTEKEAKASAAAYPIDNLKPLADAEIPLLHVVGQIDHVVPVAENTDVVEKRYLEMGGEITVIRKPDCDHHPHSLPDPTPIVEFVLKHTLEVAEDEKAKTGMAKP